MTPVERAAALWEALPIWRPFESCHDKAIGLIAVAIRDAVAEEREARRDPPVEAACAEIVEEMEGEPELLQSNVVYRCAARLIRRLRRENAELRARIGELERPDCG